MQIFIRGWLVFDMTGSALALGWVSVGAGIPLLLFSPFGGAVSDRVDKRNLLIISQSLMGITTLIIAVLIVTGAIALWHLIVAAVIMGTLLAFDLPCRQALFPQLVEQRQLMNAIALSSGSLNLNRVFAPALGGILVGLMGVGGVYFLMAACYAVSTRFLIHIPPYGRPVWDSSATVTGDIREGLSHILYTPILLGLLLIALVPLLFGMPYQLLMPVFAADVLDVGASGLGYLMGAIGIGALAGSILVASLSDFEYKGLLLLCSTGLFGIFLILFASSGYFCLSLILLLAVGAANSVQLSTTSTLLLIHSEEKFRGRVMGFYTTTIGIFPIAVLPASAIAESLGVSVAVGAGGVIMVLFIIAMTIFRPSLRRL